MNIAIVGAGVSGVFTAWRLQEHFNQQGHEKKVVVYEASRRVGGRLLSVRPPHISDMVAELGGMRILPAVQPRISKLIGELNGRLTGDRQIELYDFPVDEDQNIAYLRGVHLRLSDFQLNPAKVPYRVSFLERGMTAGQILVNAIEQIVPGITNPTLTEEARRKMTQGATFCDRPLYQQGFWNVLMRVISGEAYLLGVDAGGYNSTLTNWNAADAIPWFLSDFGVAPEYKGFRRGFQQVPLTLAELFEQAGGEIRLRSPLDGFRQANGGYELNFSGKTVDAKALILAMPRRSLDLVAPNSPPLREISHLIESVTPRPLFKLFTTYEYPWWNAAGFYKGSQYTAVEAGRSVTDLPVRQIYYWPKQDGTPALAGSAMLLASYDDGTNIGFWDGLRERRRRSLKEGHEVAIPAEPFVGVGDAKAAAPGAGSGQLWSDYPTSKGMVAEVARQLAAVHGLPFTPEVKSAAFRDWGEDPYGGGWNSWNIGERSPDVKVHMIQPIKGHPLHICGEAYSDAQGWVEGALQTAEMVLEKFGIKPL